MSLVFLKNISFVYQGEKILDDISLEINRKDYLWLIGPNGAGKTRLLQIILGILKPSSGRVRRSQDITVGYVPQDLKTASRLALSVREVLELGLKRRSIWRGKGERSLFLEKLAAVALKADVLEKPFPTLSGGQQQRVIIAQSLLLNPQLLLLDESLSGADHGVRMKVYQLLGQINREQGTAILLVSHQVEEALNHGGKILCLNRKLHYGRDPLNFFLKTT